jgi:hypothetical protein
VSSSEPRLNPIVDKSETYLIDKSKSCASSTYIGLSEKLNEISIIGFLQIDFYVQNYSLKSYFI